MQTQKLSKKLKNDYKRPANSFFGLLDFLVNDLLTGLF